MIAVSTDEGVLRIVAEVRIPNAEAGTWTPARHAKLIELIQKYINAAEVVDGKRGGLPTRRQPPRRMDEGRDGA